MKQQSGDEKLLDFYLYDEFEDKKTAGEFLLEHGYEPEAGKEELLGIIRKKRAELAIEKGKERKKAFNEKLRMFLGVEDEPDLTEETSLQLMYNKKQTSFTSDPEKQINDHALFTFIQEKNKGKKKKPNAKNYREEKE